MLWGKVHVSLIGILGGLAFSRTADVLVHGKPLGELAFPAVVLLLFVGLVVSYFSLKREVLDAADKLLREILERTNP